MLIRSPLRIVALGAFALAAASGAYADRAGAIARVTYADNVATILNKNCVSCHREGEVAPFSLVGYDNARKKAKVIAAVVGKRQMPPWKAVEGHGDFLDVRRLTAEEIATLTHWEAAGAPRGDKRKEPAAPPARGEWPIGPPDLVLAASRPYRLAAEGADVYRNFVMKTDFKETRYITAIDAKPGNRNVVHHVVVFTDGKGVSQTLNGKDNDGQDGYTSYGGPGFNPDGIPAVWAPGLQVRHTAPGTAYELKPGATLVMQVHYHKSGKEETDQTKLGVYFAKTPIQKTTRLIMLVDPRLKIPSGEKSQPWSLTWTAPADITMYWIMPHMHLLGRTMKAELELPDGSKKPLVFVDDWDFNWQMIYAYREPLKIPKGAKVHVSATYDNSADNPRNPNNPPKPVSFGEGTTDEMFALIFAVTLDSARMSAEGP